MSAIFRSERNSSRSHPPLTRRVHSRSSISMTGIIVCGSSCVAVHSFLLGYRTTSSIQLTTSRSFTRVMGKNKATENKSEKASNKKQKVESDNEV